MKTIKTASWNGDIMGTWCAFLRPSFGPQVYVSICLCANYKKNDVVFSRSGMGTFQPTGLDDAASIHESEMGTFVVPALHPTSHNPSNKIRMTQE